MEEVEAIKIHELGNLFREKDHQSADSDNDCDCEYTHRHALADDRGFGILNAIDFVESFSPSSALINTSDNSPFFPDGWPFSVTTQLRKSEFHHIQFCIHIVRTTKHRYENDPCK